LPAHLVPNILSPAGTIASLGTLAQAAAEPALQSRWTTDPQVPTWVLAAGFLLAVVASVYLYKAQARVASRKAVAALTVIRCLLILLVFVMLLGLGRVFSRTGKSDGTLWLMLDQSQSMDRADPQATPVEKLRWADALGLLPPDARPAGLDRLAARLSVLRADLLHVQSVAGQPVEDVDAKAKVADMARDLQRWTAQVSAVADAVEKSPAAAAAAISPATAPAAGGKSSAKAAPAGLSLAAVPKTLRSAVETVTRGAAAVESRTKPEEAATDLPWTEVRAALGDAADALTRQADKADADLLARGDAKVAEAVEKVGKMTRADLAREAITRKLAGGAKADAAAATANGAAGFDDLLSKQKLKVVGFGQSPQVVIPDAGQGEAAVQAALAKPAAPVTDVAGGLRAIYDQVGQGEPTSVIVVSDGRQTQRDADAAEAVRRLAGRGVRVYGLGLGTPKVAPDAAVENVDAPDWVFKGDAVKVTALLRLDNLAGKPITVELHRVRQVNGLPQDTLVDTKDVQATAAGRAVVSFSEKKEAPPEPGVYDYRVVIKDVPDEVTTANNAQAARVWVKEDKLTVLVVEDQPRWEYRYLVNYLARENRVRVQSMLLQPARIGYDPDPKKNVAPPPPRKPTTDEKDERTDFQVLPETQEEWYKWEVIVVGDVPPDKLPKKQQEMIVKAVRDRGATLLLLSGPLAMPAAWGTSRADYPLAELFPCDPAPEWTPGALAAHLKVGYHPTVAPDGEGNVLTQLGIDDQQTKRVWQTVTTDPNLAWYWHTEYTQAKGGASVIWSIADNDPAAVASAAAGARKAATNPSAADDAKATADAKSASGPTALEIARRRALLTTVNAGFGKVMFLGGDASWRLRQVNGVNYHERFWGQFIRWAVDNTLPAGGKFVRFGSDKPRYVGGEQAMVTARIVNKDLVPQAGLTVKVRARALANPGGGGGGATQPAAAASAAGSASAKADSPSKVLTEAEMVEVPGAPGRYQAVLGDLPAGQVELSLHGPEVEQLLAADEKAAMTTLGVEVAAALNLEQRNVNADLPALAGLSAAGGGAMLPLAYADVLAGQIPELNYTTTSAEQIGLFTDPKERYAAVSHWVFLAAFALLATAEWIIRKAAGLV
jgi:hypothetical protein